MADIGHLNRPKAKSLAIDLGEGDTINIVFNVNAITPALLELAIKDALPQTIMEWDVTKDGQPFPPTPENVASLSYPIQHALVAEIVAAAKPSDAEGNASGNISSTPSTDSMPEPASLLNGQEPSSSPTVSASPSPT